jgi:hypothetical protein
MAIDREMAEKEANAVRQICEETVTLFHRINQLLEDNSDKSIDWNGNPIPSYFLEQENGNLYSLPFSRAQVSNAIFSLDQIRRVLTNQTTTQGDHLGNLNIVARPFGIR